MDADIPEQDHIVHLDPGRPFRERFHKVGPLIVVGTQNEDDTHNPTSKCRTTPMEWDHHPGFVCMPH